MLVAEARWLGARIDELGDRLSPLLDLGSSTPAFRQSRQPWIEEHIHERARRRGIAVVTSDIKAAPGIELVGDLRDAGVRETVARRGVKAVLCANLLEHVPDRDALARAIVSIVPAGGLILATGPRRYPWHADPIDTGYRPSPEELARAFPGTEVVAAEVVRDTTYLPYLARAPLRSAARLLVPFYKPRGWWTAVNALPWVFRRFEATCVVLRRLPA